MATSLSVSFSDLRLPTTDLRLPRTEERISEQKLLLLPPPPISKLDGQDDLLLEILTRALTDPGSAARSKSVCKNWNSLLSSPYFFRRFIQHQQQRQQHATDDETLLMETMLSILPRMSEEARARFRILSRAKDLTLCGFDRLPKSFLFVCNHYTNQLVAVIPPPSPPAESQDPPPYCFLSCNPRNEHQFKVLLIHPRDRKLQFFSSESEKWTDRKIDGLYSVKEMTVWNGKLYWLDSKLERVVEYNLYRGSPLVATVRFDANPVCLNKKSSAVRIRSSVLRVSGGDLYAVRLLGSGSLSVWRLGDDSKEWRMLYEVYSDKLRWCEEKDERLVLDAVIGQDPENPEVVFLQFVGCDGAVLVACNLRTRTLQRVEDEWLRHSRFAWGKLVHNYNKLRGGCED
ncbi:hypothetical protein LINGRAHAP2_LOCUS35981 [Linum grandiflorum]